MVVLDALRIGPLELHKHIAFICDCEHRTIQTGQDIIAVIGEDVLGQQPFAINFRDCTLTLYDESSFVPPASEAFALRSTADTPEVRGSIEGREGWFEIDTGYSEPVILTRAFAELNSDLIQSRPQFRSQEVWSENQQSYGLYFASVDILGQHILEEFGSYDAADRFGRRTSGLIGVPCFRDCVLTIDMIARRAWCQHPDAEPLDSLINRLRDHAEKKRVDRSSLSQAASLKRVDAIEKLLQAGESVDQADDLGLTPLMIAVGRGDSSAVEMLLAHGAQVDAKTKADGYTPLLIASRYGRAEAAKLLLAAGADANKATESGRTPLFLASELNYADVVSLLLGHDSLVDKSLPSGETPLLAACANGNRAVAELLLARHANPNAMGPRGTCLSYAAQVASPDCVKLLLSHGADPNRRAPRGSSPLITAAAIGSRDAAECVRLLLAAGADANSKTVDVSPTKNGKTALDVAIEHGEIQSIDLLHAATTRPAK